MKNLQQYIRPNLAGDYPEIHPSALIDPSAQIIGQVKIGKNVFIAPLTIIRADERGPDGTVSPIIIGEEVNIQDGVIIHTHGGQSVTIGARTSVFRGKRARESGPAPSSSTTPTPARRLISVLMSW